MAATAVTALALAAATLRRRQGRLPRRVRRALIALPVVLVVTSAIAGAYSIGNARAYIATDNAHIDGDALPIRSPATGTPVDWSLAPGSVADDVRVGQVVDIEVDAFPATTLTGAVDEIQRSTAGATGPLPTSSVTAEFQKITQVVPVRVAIADGRGLALVPGMNVTVRIHRS